MQIIRYGIYNADLTPTLGAEINKIRPVVVVSKNNMNRNLETIVICPLTTKIHKSWRSRIQIKLKNKNAEIAVDQIRTISKIRIKNKIGILDVAYAFKLRCLIIEMYGE